MITSGSGRPLESDMALVVKMWQENNVLVLGVGLEERWPPSRHRGHTLGLGLPTSPSQHLVSFTTIANGTLQISRVGTY